MIFCCSSVVLFAQTPIDTLPKDPGLISIFNIQPLNFGSFFLGNTGGTISVSAEGARTVTGDILIINQGIPPLPAIFEVEAPANTIINIQNGPDVTLTGSNGGTMRLHISNSLPASPFIAAVAPPGRTQVNIGGTLTVGSPQLNRPGTYSGTFSIMFIQQ